MSNVKFICSKCDSDDVEHAMWVNPNTETVGDTFGTWNEDDASFCNNCESTGTLIENRTRPSFQKTIALDFDGVIHSYTSLWTFPNEIHDGPTPLALAAVNDYIKAGLKVVVFSARARAATGRQAIQDWLKKHNFPDLEITSVKPHAVLYVDDRAHLFTGANFPSVADVVLFNPWNKRNATAHFPLRSERGFPLVGLDRLIDEHTLTVELYDKWYCLYDVDPQGNVRRFEFTNLEKYAKGDETAYCDHAPNPEIVERCAEECDFYLPSLALELITGRWKLEHG